ncbi:hypothetical protein PG996_005185 [Apiospora saccharicola]|uniref:Uncharacterized protein n=1 Tax=Apiospora saccharicola TaxID=335842 RepID=A0ABR1VKT6_9PEZI
MESFGVRSNSESLRKPGPEDSQAKHTDSQDTWRSIRQQLGDGNQYAFATINGLFSLPDPVIINNENGGSGTSWNPDFREVSKEYVSTWDDFNEETVDTIFGDFLDERTYEFFESNLMSIYHGC